MSTFRPLPTEFLDRIPDLILVTDAAGTLVQANQKARKALALGDASPSVTDLFPFRDPDLRPEENFPFEDIVRSLDGREFRVLVRTSPLEGGSLWMVTDLTRQQDDRQGMIDYMADLTTAQTRIREYTRQIEVFRQIVDGMDEGVVLTDPDGRVGFSNAFANRLFGLELTGRPVSEMKTLVSPVAEASWKELLKGEVLVLNEAQGRQTRCYLNVAPLNREGPADEGMVVWTFFELTEEIANTQAFIDFSSELTSMNKDLRIRNEKILHLSRTDGLTGISNRRTILEILEKALGFGSSRQQDLTILLFDLDHFKEINDTRGHLAGDEAIRLTCALAAAEVGEAGTMGRYGGEEFLVVLPGFDLGQGRILAEEIRTAVENGTRAKSIPVTATFGLACRKAGETLDDLLGAADRALYEGKAGGRNRVVART